MDAADTDIINPDDLRTEILRRLSRLFRRRQIRSPGAGNRDASDSLALRHTLQNPADRVVGHARNHFADSFRLLSVCARPEYFSVFFIKPQKDCFQHIQGLALAENHLRKSRPDLPVQVQLGKIKILEGRADKEMLRLFDGHASVFYFLKNLFCIHRQLSRSARVSPSFMEPVR